MTWIIENEAFSGGDILLSALRELNKDVILWDDKFWNTEEYKSFPKDCIFRGSLENVEKLYKKQLFHSGLYNDQIFSYSFFSKFFKDYMFNKDVVFTSISEVLTNPSIIKQLNSEKVFVRPDSSLKEFSGRIIPSENLTPAHFDYDFYHNNLSLPIVLSSVKSIEKEYRFVCVNQQIVAGCEYLADGRKGGRAILSEENNPAYLFAQKMVDDNPFFYYIYVIDICLSNGSFYLLEINPFGGADLYNCDAKKIIESIEEGGRKRKEYDALMEALNVEDVWHEDSRWKNQILSRCHGSCFTDIFSEDGLYKVEIYLDDDMASWKSFTSLEDAKEFAEKEMLRLDAW